MKNQFPLGWTPPNKQLGQSNQVPNLLYKPYVQQNPMPPVYGWLDDELKKLCLYCRMKAVFKIEGNA